MEKYRFKTFSAGRMRQVRLSCAADLEHLEELDRKRWLVVSLPVAGVRFDTRTLEFLDSDRDGRIRFDEVLGAIGFLKSHGIDLGEVFDPPKDLAERLADVRSRQSDLEKIPLSSEEKSALDAWEAQGKTPEVAVLGAATADADAALAAIEPLVAPYFAPPEETALVLDVPERKLSLTANVNPRHRAAFSSFVARCVKPILGDVTELGFGDWQTVCGRFAPYRAWRKAMPQARVDARAVLEDEERTILYRMLLLELLENFVNMRRLYDTNSRAIFQTGTLRIDARELSLCLPVADEGAHAALADHSSCCLLYVKLTRPSEGLTREICAAVTAGSIGSLYVGRNGVFCDRDGRNWEATVVKIVESQVSLAEAFWAPWKKIGETVVAMMKKALGDRQAAAEGSVKAAVQPGGGSQAAGAALASSVAAIGIGIGMVGAAAASLMAAVSRLNAWQSGVSVLALIAVVSLPSVILTWFKLRRRDLGAILNASGWAVNRPLRMSRRLARTFTVGI